ncbi:MAG: hypothetical protein PHN69_05490 [Candidatus Pacebacteria bacterium]|nr:hypothetical protein [Candidatus Paceibacterota bacterium]
MGKEDKKLYLSALLIFILTTMLPLPAYGITDNANVQTLVINISDDGKFTEVIEVLSKNGFYIDEKKQNTIYMDYHPIQNNASIFLEHNWIYLLIAGTAIIVYAFCGRVTNAEFDGYLENESSYFCKDSNCDNVYDNDYVAPINLNQRLYEIHNPIRQPYSNYNF